MRKFTNTNDLKMAIQELEYKQAFEWTLLKEDYLYTCERFKPINLIKSTLRKAVSSPVCKFNLVNAAIGLTTGLFAKKLLIGKTHNPLKKLLGIILETFVAGKVVQNAEVIKSAGNAILNKINHHPGNSGND